MSKNRKQGKILWVSDDPLQRQPPQHNYAKKLLEMEHSGALPIVKGRVTHIHIAHDDWCKIHNGMFCNCDPEITFELD